MNSLGDVGKAEYIKEINARKKILILGNHDAKGKYRNYFNEIYTGPVFIADRILLSHEPVYGLPWCLNIHGHDHNGVLSDIPSIHRMTIDAASMRKR